MKEDKLGETTAVRLKPDVIDFLDSFRRNLPYEPSRGAIIRQIVGDWVESQRRQLTATSPTVKPRRGV